MNKRVQILTLITALLVASPGWSAPTDRCSALMRVALPDTSITSARAVPAGPMQEPGASGEIQLPAHCRVTGNTSAEAGSDIRFEVWIPLSGWNGRLYGMGNGGFGGSISQAPGLAETVQRGAAGVATDTGHVSSAPDPATDGAWARGHQERIKDYGYRAIHLSAVVAKSLILALYGQPVRRAYFASCSNGGRQALMEAQRYPEDYDGIIAGAPAYDWTGLTADFIWNVQAQRHSGATITAAKVPALQTAVLRACRARDGLVDDARLCKLDPRILLCKGAETDGCLTAPQVGALQKIYSGPHTSGGERIYPGFPATGAELGSVPGMGWDGWIFAPAGAEAYEPKYATAILSDFSTSVSAGIDEFDFDRDYPRLESELAPILNATDPDLTDFAGRGGKLILWHGWADPALPPQHTIDYFEAVRARLGGEKTARTLRLFMVPGMQHCFGGPGPNSFGQLTPPVRPVEPHSDLAGALERWVEEGVAPDQVIAHHASNPFAGALDWHQADQHKEYLLCPYPEVAVPSRGHDLAAASSYRCAKSVGRP